MAELLNTLHLAGQSETKTNEQTQHFLSMENITTTVGIMHKNPYADVSVTEKILAEVFFLATE